MWTIVALSLFAACPTEAPPPVVEAPPVVDVPKGPTFDYADKAGSLNVILISMDALRYDRTGLGGGTITPNLDALQKESVAFSDTTAAAPWTVPSHMAIFTGLWPTRHGVTNKLAPNTNQDDLVFARLADDIPTFSEKMVGAGFNAVAFTGGAGVSGKFGYNRGFTSYLDDKTFAGMDYSGPAAEAWLRENKAKPDASHFFMFFHGYDVHGQHPLIDQTPRAAVPTYTGKMDGSIEEQAKLREAGLAEIKNPGDPANGDISPEDTAFLLAVYDAKVREADARLGKFVATLKELGLYDTSIIVLLADHGEEFMEHDYLDHGATLCQHQLHVPLSFRFPNGEGAQLVQTPVRTIDAFPTVFDALGLPPIPDVDGQSLIPLIRGEKVDLPVRAESDYRLFVRLRAARVGDKKVILDLQDGQKTLFDVAADPQETNDLSVADPRTTYEIEQDVRAWMSAMKVDPSQYLGKREETIKIF